jgi:hypothetical protein
MTLVLVNQGEGWLITAGQTTAVNAEMIAQALGESGRDPHGQPLNPLLNRRRRIEREVSEVLGIAKGMLADGVVNQEEARFLHDWGRNHPDGLNQWPVNLIFTADHDDDALAAVTTPDVDPTCVDCGGPVCLFGGRATLVCRARLARPRALSVVPHAATARASLAHARPHEQPSISTHATHFHCKMTLSGAFKLNPGLPWR